MLGTLCQLCKKYYNSSSYARKNCITWLLRVDVPDAAREEWVGWIANKNFRGVYIEIDGAHLKTLISAVVLKQRKYQISKNIK